MNEKGGEKAKCKIPIDLLTTRELEVAAQLATGYANKHVAERLRIAPKTVETHRKNITGKLRKILERTPFKNLTGIALITYFALGAEIVENPIEVIEEKS